MTISWAISRSLTWQTCFLSLGILKSTSVMHPERQRVILRWDRSVKWQVVLSTWEMNWTAEDASVMVTPSDCTVSGFWRYFMSAERYPGGPETWFRKGREMEGYCLTLLWSIGFPLVCKSSLLSWEGSWCQAWDGPGKARSKRTVTWSTRTSWGLYFGGIGAWEVSSEARQSWKGWCWGKKLSGCYM